MVLTKAKVVKRGNDYWIDVEHDGVIASLNLSDLEPGFRETFEGWAKEQIEPPELMPLHENDSGFSN
jgi:hypothetical protein